MSNRTEHEQKDIDYHAATAHEYDAVVVEPRELANEILFADVESAVPTGGRMLDLGCGTGHSLLRFGRRFDAVIGIDHSPEMLAQARSKLESSDIRNTVLLRQDLFDFLESTVTPFHFVTAIGCFHHLKPARLAEVLGAIAGLLVPGGRLLIADPIEVDLSQQPLEVAEWNAASIAANLTFTSEEDEADEAPLDYARLAGALAGAGLSPLAETRGWELFPRHSPPTRGDRDTIARLHLEYGSSGNVLCAVHQKS